MFLWQARKLTGWVTSGPDIPENEKDTFLSKSSGLWEHKVGNEEGRIGSFAEDDNEEQRKERP